MGLIIPKDRSLITQADDWVPQRVGDITTEVASGTSRYCSVGDFPVFGSTGIIGKTSCPEYSGWAILVARVGAYAGKIGEANGRYGVTDNTIIVRPKRSVYGPYLKLQLEKQNLNSLVFGSGQPLITGTQIKNLVVPIPPTEREQRAIAEALADADSYIHSLEQLFVKKRAVMQGAMDELLTGKRRLAGFRCHWTASVLGELVAFHKGRGLAKAAIVPGGTARCIHYGELFTLYPAIIKNVVGRTHPAADAFLSERNDVLMPTSDVTPNGLAKASCIVHGGVVLGGDILVMRPDQNALSGSFLAYLIRQQEPQVLQMVSGTTVFHIYSRDMALFRLSLPPVAEQDAIVSILDDMESDIRATDEKIRKARDIKQGMMQELLTGSVRFV